VEVRVKRAAIRKQEHFAGRFFIHIIYIESLCFDEKNYSRHRLSVTRKEKPAGEIPAGSIITKSSKAT
jgi:hypothetical protein